MVNIFSLFSSWEARVLDWFFPRLCLGCGRGEAWLCPSCYAQLGQAWHLNREPLAAVETLVSLWPFSETLVRECLHNLKYNGIKEAAGLLIGLASQVCQPEVVRQQLSDQVEFWDCCLLVPVPTSNTKLKYRGYNQAELLAKEISSWLSLPCQSNILIRAGPKKSQVGQDLSSRQGQASMAFQIKRDYPVSDLRNQKIILVDDLCASGSTLNACASVLQPHTRYKICALTVAREY